MGGEGVERGRSSVLISHIISPANGFSCKGRGMCPSGSIAFIHRFGSTLNAHLHFHCIVIDSVFEPAAGGSSFMPPAASMPPPSPRSRREVRRRLLRGFVRRGLLPADRAGRERLLRYSRPATVRPGPAAPARSPAPALPERQARSERQRCAAPDAAAAARTPRRTRPAAADPPPPLLRRARAQLTAARRGAAAQAGGGAAGDAAGHRGVGAALPSGARARAGMPGLAPGS